MYVIAVNNIGRGPPSAPVVVTTGETVRERSVLMNKKYCKLGRGRKTQNWPGAQNFIGPALSTGTGLAGGPYLIQVNRGLSVMLLVPISCNGTNVFVEENYPESRSDEGNFLSKYSCPKKISRNNLLRGIRFQLSKNFHGLNIVVPRYEISAIWLVSIHSVNSLRTVQELKPRCMWFCAIRRSSKNCPRTVHIIKPE
ncbi:hypothetical protein NQ317_008058 [Molorchus minor]|uniref:Uncharacterized protein n=1 Tax=Molorchus minor TaxID=1323400 RepID=A0ABQ9IT33_9CUCU|nr:hypothetical protein NQ317_008058 [Molorchus minor]